MRDTEIVASIVAGDSSGLAAACDQYADSLFKYCGTLLSDPADAADAVRNAFIIAASRLDGLRAPERLRAWLYAVARGECRRIAASKKGTSALDQAPDVTDDRADAGEHVQRAQLRGLFEAAAAGLNPGEREVIELRLRQGLEAREVAAVLGVSRNHARTLLSRARDQLESCLGVLLVGRAGRGECGELRAMLDGWDGRLTVLLRKRVHRHIEHCATCTARRASELRPARLLDLSPGAAMAAGAAESLRRALRAPAGLKAHTIALATGHGPGAVAHSGAVLARAGTFGKQGFPKTAHAARAAGAGPPGAGRGRALRSSPRRQGAVAAAVVIAVAITAVAFALAGSSEHLTPSADPKPANSGPPPAAPPASAVAVAVRASPAPGALSVRPDGGTMLVVPGLIGSLVSLHASGGTVSWSASVASDPGHVVSVSPASGTLTPADPAATLTVTVRQFTRCGPGRGARCPTITVSPGGATFAVRAGGTLPFPPGGGPRPSGTPPGTPPGPAPPTPAPPTPALVNSPAAHPAL